jgi:hypothetical protein
MQDGTKLLIDFTFFFVKILKFLTEFFERNLRCFKQENKLPETRPKIFRKNSPDKLQECPKVPTDFLQIFHPKNSRRNPPAKRT